MAVTEYRPKIIKLEQLPLTTQGKTTHVDAVIFRHRQEIAKLEEL